MTKKNIKRFIKWLFEPDPEYHIPGTGFSPRQPKHQRPPAAPPNCGSSVTPKFTPPPMPDVAPAWTKYYVGFDLSAAKDMAGFSMCVEPGFVGKRTKVYESGGYRYEFSVRVSKIEEDEK